jgi:hypothetical protein
MQRYNLLETSQSMLAMCRFTCARMFLVYGDGAEMYGWLWKLDSIEPAVCMKSPLLSADGNLLTCFFDHL